VELPSPAPPPQDPSSTLNPSVSLMITSGSTETYYPTIVSSNATIVSILVVSITDACGSVVCLVIFPTSCGRGWEFPCSLGYCGSPFPPPPPPPLNLSLSANLTSDSVSSTMTTLPSGFFTEMSSNSLWTGNTWVTTEAGGSSTIVPVIVGCHNCGGDYGGIVLWNLPRFLMYPLSSQDFPNSQNFTCPALRFLVSKSEIVHQKLIKILLVITPIGHKV
jgi:hypothetical protein